MRNVRVKHALGWTIGAAGAIAGLAGVGALVAMRRPLPRTSGTISIHGISQHVQVLRDRWGIPHIYAENQADLFAALGYIHAQDRLWQMELNRRTGHGQLAELFGSLAIETDRFVRVLGFSRTVQHEVALLDDRDRTLIESYVRGVNSFIETHLHALPIEFTLLRHHPRPWEVADVLVWGKVIALNLAGYWTNELLNAHIVDLVGEQRAQELSLGHANDQPHSVLKAMYNGIGERARQHIAQTSPFLKHNGDSQGSNAWVISGHKSASGSPLLASDPHLILTLPSIWYEAHLECGNYRVTGVTFPGVPAIVIGHNEHIAWGITNSMIDVQDLYIERFDTNNTLRYQWQEHWENAQLIREEIKVRGRTQPIIEEVRITRHGPVITPIITPSHSRLQWQNMQHYASTPSTTEEVLALRWTALEPCTITHGMFCLNRAQNWEEFRAALAYWDTPSQNFVYADVDGHYGYLLAGKIPIRSHYEGRLPLPGWSGAYEWDGYIPADELPFAYDPPEGMIVTANNRITHDEHPHSSSLRGYWFNHYRAARIEHLLQAQPTHTITSFSEIQLDVFSLPGRELAKLCANVPLEHPLEQTVRDMLVAWDGNLHAETIGGTIYVVLRHHLELRAFAELRDLLHAPAGHGIFQSFPLNQILERRTLPAIIKRIALAEEPERRDQWLRNGRTWNDILKECISETVAELCSRFGNNPHHWQYKRMHNLTLYHPLGAIRALSPIFNRGTWSLNGDIDTVCMGYVPHQATRLPLYTAPSYRQICDTGNWDASCSIISGGQSGHPASPHYSDMVDLWHTGQYHPMVWSRSQVEQHCVATLILKPRTVEQETKELCNNAR